MPDAVINEPVQPAANAVSEACRTADGLRWVVEKRGITLVTSEGAVCQLIYPAAAVWDLMVRGYRFPKLVDMLCHIAAIDHGEAVALVRQSLEEWVSAGYLRRETC